MRAINRELVSRRARELAVDEGFAQILATLKEESLVLFANTTSNEAARREEIYRDLQAIGRLEGRVAALVSNAVIEERKEERAARRAEKGPLRR